MKKNIFTKIFAYLFSFIFIATLGFFLVSNFSHSHNYLPSSLSLSPGLAHAQSPPKPVPPPPQPNNQLHLDLTSGGNASTAWIFTVWRIMMTLANAFVALALIFFAFVSIAHINYDTYQLKKTFPKLIIGIILANFSMVICRMIVDISSVLTATFTQDLHGLMMSLLCALGFQANGDIASVVFTYWAGIGLIWMILVFIAIFLGIAILGFIFLIRHAVILVLAATAPIAFILLAFPPTEQYFKKWWSWFINWTFMGPISIMILWIAQMVGSNSCGATYNFTQSFTALMLVYLAAIVPFKLGGGVMGAWGKLGKKGAGLGYKGATKNAWSQARAAKGKRYWGDLAGNTRVGKSWNKALAEGKWETGQHEENVSERAADAMDAYRTGQGKSSNYGDQVRRQIGLKRVKEQVSDLDLTSREGLAESFNRMAKNEDKQGTNALLEHAMENAMLADIMQETHDSPEAKKNIIAKFGIPEDFAFDDTSRENQNKFINYVVGEDDLKTQNRIQEAGVKAGIADMKDIVAEEGAIDPKTNKVVGFRRLSIGEDLGDPDGNPGEANISAEEKKKRQDRQNDNKKFSNMTTKRFQSPDAHKAIRQLRKETLFDKDGNLNTIGINLLKDGLLTEEHIKLLGRGRTSLLQAFNNPGNLDRLQASALSTRTSGEKDANLKASRLENIAAELQRLGYGRPPENMAQVIIPSPQGGGLAYSNIDSLTPQQITPAVERQIADRASRVLGPTNITQIQNIDQQVQNNPNLRQEFKRLIKGIAGLKGAHADVLGLGTADGQQTESIVNKVSKTIGDEIGNALQNHIDISPIVQQIVNGASEPIKVKLKQQIHDEIANSDAPVLAPPGGTPVTSRNIIQAYEAASPKGQKLSDEKVKLDFISLVQDQAGPGVQLSATELDRAWRLVETYNGKSQGKPDAKKARQNLEEIMANQQALDEENYEEK